MPSKGIAPLAKAIRKARMNEMQLTSIHGSLLQLCLIAKNLKPALEFLNVDVTEISTEVYRCRFIILKCLVWETYYKYFLFFFHFFVEWLFWCQTLSSVLLLWWCDLCCSEELWAFTILFWSCSHHSFICNFTHHVGILQKVHPRVSDSARKGDEIELYYMFMAIRW